MRADTAELATAARPTAIGPYGIVRELGRGGMGVVYEAVHAQLGKRVALKLMRAEPLQPAAEIERFIREGRAACHIRHPNVIEVLELGAHAGMPYLVMTLLDGITLGELLQASHRVPLPAALNLMLPILSAVSAAHAAGVVHRDLKPSNVMLAREAEELMPILLDFGVSKLQEPVSTPPLTKSGVVLGTLPYMAAEQMHASQQADARSDQYSLAVILYECLTGRRPFEASSAYELMQAIVTAPVIPPSALVPELPTALDGVILRALDRDPQARFPSVGAMGSALLAFAPGDRYERFRAEFRHESDPEHSPHPSAGVTAVDTARAITAPALESRVRAATWMIAALLTVIAVASAALWLSGDKMLQSATNPAVRALPESQPIVVTAHAPSPLQEAREPESPHEIAAPLIMPARAVRARPQAPAARKPRARTIEMGENGAPILE